MVGLYSRGGCCSSGIYSAVKMHHSTAKASLNCKSDIHIPRSKDLSTSLYNMLTFWKGADRSVSTVPGCSRMQATFCFRRPNSTDIVFVSWFSAVLDAL